MAIKFRTEADAVEELKQLGGPKFLAYRELWDRVNRFELETEFPLFLHIESNYQCNFRCPMCTQGVPELKEKFGYSERLETQDIAKILEQAKQFGCPSISFQGDNEPFLIKQIPDWFRMAKDAGFQDIMVNTNGSVMNERLATRIVESGLTRLRFSLDAITNETYSKIRIGGNFKKVMQNIEIFLNIRSRLQSPLPKVGVNFVKMAINAHEVEAFEQYWANKVDYIVIQDFMTPDIQGDYRHLDVAERSSIPEFRCQQPWQRLYIRGNGDVTPCCAMFSSYLKLGNIHENSLIDLWKSPQAKELRRLHAEGRYRENAVCLKCSKNGGGGQGQA
jgi:radical SAM protein with 4Fe4S-binding SPASM domain